jgi:hypothetical protein
MALAELPHGFSLWANGIKYEGALVQRVSSQKNRNRKVIMMNQ